MSNKGSLAAQPSTSSAVDYPMDFSEFERPKLMSGFLGAIMTNPFLTIGVAGTTVALVSGLKSMVSGDSARTQVAMRWRIGMQAFGVAAMVGGIMLQARKAEKSIKEKRGY